MIDSVWITTGRGETRAFNQRLAKRLGREADSCFERAEKSNTTL